MSVSMYIRFEFASRNRQLIDNQLMIIKPCEHTLAAAWFLKVALSVCVWVCVCVYLPLMLLMTTDVVHTSYDRLSKVYSFTLAAVVDVISRHDHRIDVRHRNQPNKRNPALYKLLV